MTDDDEKPAYGQVWAWDGKPFMLVHRTTTPGKWIVAFLYEPGRASLSDRPMSGLYDDPGERIQGYERVS